MTLRFFSYGGGVQSTAALVLAAEGKIDFPVFFFSNVGADSEHPATIRYVEDYAKPYAAAQGIELAEITPTKNGQPVTLYQDVMSETLRSISIPVRGKNGAPGRRSCTKHFKVVPIARETKRRGATKDASAVIGLGISIDEFQRMRKDSPIAWQQYEYPLIDLRLNRNDCEQIIAKAGLPVPPKSSCWFCPFHRNSVWRTMKTQEPELFMNAVVLELDINAKQRRNGQPPSYLSRMGVPLHEAFDHDQAMMDLDVDDTCESGYCLT